MQPSLRISLSLLLLWHAAARAGDPEPKFHRLWVYAGCNFQVDKDVERFVALLRRAKAAGYNGVVLHDSKFARLDEPRPARWYRNVEQMRQVAEEIGIELIPRVIPIGYSNSILSNNPHLAAGVPVRECVFTVRNGKATVAQPENLLPFGDFERFTQSRPEGWEWMDGPGKSIFEDQAVKHSGTASLRMEQFNEGNPHGLCRVVKKLTLEPWHQYDLSLWIKTQTVARPSTIRVALLTDMPDGPRHNLGRQSLGVRSTQDWRRHDVVFNTFAHRDVWLYLGAWDAREGRIWIDDVSLREVAGVNLLRREGCPVRVTSADGGQEYVEGQDFQRWEYPEMGRVPYGGVYQPVHPEPPLVLTPNSRIHEGQALKVSFYHTMRILDGQVCCCLRSDELFEHLEAHVRRVHELLHSPKTYFMSYDEIRLAGWCALCDTPHTTTGEILAENVRRCTEIIRRVAPDAEIVVWSDMFDPYHNAVDRYWHTRGTMKGSWNGLDPSLIIGNWNFGNRDASLAFFADRGHRQMIAAYYDRPQWQRSLGKWLQSADKVPGIEGVIYTTWMRDYRNLEAFADFVHGSSRRDTDRRDSPPKRN